MDLIKVRMENMTNHNGYDYSRENDGINIKNDFGLGSDNMVITQEEHNQKGDSGISE